MKFHSQLISTRLIYALHISESWQASPPRQSGSPTTQTTFSDPLSSGTATPSGTTSTAVALPGAAAGALATTEPPIFQCPRRPNLGREGRPIVLKANHFQITMPRGYVHHYDVNIQPDKCPRKVKNTIIPATLKLI